MDTFGRIVVWTIYTFHIDHVTPQHTASEQSAVCLSVIFGYFLVLYRLQICDCWVNFREKHSMNMTYKHPTTIYRSIVAQLYKFLVEKYIFTIFA